MVVGAAVLCYLYISDFVFEPILLHFMLKLAQTKVFLKIYQLIVNLNKAKGAKELYYETITVTRFMINFDLSVIRNIDRFQFS